MQYHGLLETQSAIADWVSAAAQWVFGLPLLLSRAQACMGSAQIRAETSAGPTGLLALLRGRHGHGLLL
jgi:hypothetical protein